MIIQVYIGPETEKFLDEQARELDRPIEELAEAAITEYCLNIANKRHWNRS